MPIRKKRKKKAKKIKKKKLKKKFIEKKQKLVKLTRITLNEKMFYGFQKIMTKKLKQKKLRNRLQKRRFLKLKIMQFILSMELDKFFRLAPKLLAVQKFTVMKLNLQKIKQLDYFQ